jgi:hypothetical protein
VPRHPVGRERQVVGGQDLPVELAVDHREVELADVAQRALLGRAGLLLELGAVEPVDRGAAQA